MKTSLVISGALLVVSTVSAQTWELLPLDTFGWVHGMELRQYAAESVMVCYTVGEAPCSIYVAVLVEGTAVSREHVCTSPGMFAYPSFDISPQGTMGIVWGHERELYFWQRDDSGWVGREAATGGGWPGLPHLTYDRDGVPNIIFSTSYRGAVRSRLLDTTWVVDTAFTYTSVGPGWVGFWLVPAVFTTDNRPHIFLREEVWFNSQIWWDFLHYVTHAGDSWETKWSVGGGEASYWLLALAAGPDDSIHLLYDGYGTTYLDGVAIPGVGFTSATMRYDSENQPHLLLHSPGAAEYSYRTPSGWHSCGLPRTAYYSDFELGDNDEPIVAFSGNDTVWLARGLDIVAVDESTTAKPAAQTGQTVCRGGLALPRGHDGMLLDISGRRVMSLRPGPNDIRHVAPGVYFLWSAESGERSAVRKVVVQR